MTTPCIGALNAFQCVLIFEIHDGWRTGYNHLHQGSDLPILQPKDSYGRERIMTEWKDILCVLCANNCGLGGRHRRQQDHQSER